MTQSDIINDNFSKLKSRKRDIFPKYELGSDVAIFNELQAMKRSTFDRSKFEEEKPTTGATLTITNEGIASGFSNGNFIYKNIAINSSNQIFEGSFNIHSINTEWHSIFNATESGAMRVGLRYKDSQLALIGFDTQQITVYTPFTDYNKDINYKIVVSSNEINLYLNGEYKTRISSSNLKTTIDTVYIGIGVSNYAPLTIGSIDLKQFSITVDGVEVLNGNKTGIDQIKKDDFTKVVPSSGTPTLTITDDGIVSGFSGSKRLDYIVNWNNPNSSYKELYKIRVDERNANVVQRVNGCLNHVGTYLSLYNDKLCFAFTTSAKQGSSWEKEWYSVGNQLELGVWYYVKFEWDGVKYTFSYKSEKDNNYTILGTHNSAEPIYQGLTYLLGTGSNTAQPFRGSIDLNSFKIYVDDNLVYQPTLRIPYTQSKTGCKIVDAVYRDRVRDMYEQFGYTNYYTLGDDDYTLATVPNEQIVDSYYADNSFMELTADLALTQGGGAVSGQTVNLKRAYVNNKYIATIGTSSKDTNSFVASASGQWITKGKGVLG